MAADTLVFAITLLRLLVPSLALGLIAVQLTTTALNRLFLRLQASSFGETASGYQRILDSHGGAQTGVSSLATADRRSVVLPPDENGVLPVVVPIRSIRRGLVYSLLVSVVLSYILQGGVLIAHSIVSMQWESSTPVYGLLLWKHQEYYLLGSATALTVEILVMAFQERTLGLGGFRKVYPVLITLLLLAGEAALLGVLAKRIEQAAKGHRSDHDGAHLRLDGWTIAHLVFQAVRVLVLFLSLLAFTPLLQRTTFLPNEYRQDGSSSTHATATEGAGLLQPGGETPGNGYGTFGSNSNPASKPPSVRNGQTPDSQQDQTPAAPIPEHKKSFWARIKVLSPYLWPKKSRTLQFVAFVCFVLLGVGRVVNLFVPRTLGKLVEDLSTGVSPWKHLLVYAGLRFLQGSGGLTQVLQSTLWIPVAQYSEREMSEMTFSHLLNLSLSFQVKKKTGEVLRTLDRGSAINSFFQVILFQFVPIGVDIVIAIVYLWITFGTLLASLVTVVMVTYVAASVLLTRLRVKLRRDMNDKDKYTRGIHADALANWETIKYFTAENREIARYITAMKAYQGAEFQVIASLNFLNLTQNAIISLGLVIGSLIVAFSVVNGQRSVGEFVMFLTYLTQLYGPLNALGTLYRVIQTNLVDTDNLMKLLAEETEIVDKPNARELGNATGAIELDHVNFSYDGKVVALKDLNIKIAPGTSVALVGESGSGKSTLLRLLYRFYDVSGGAIRFDGIDIRDVTQTSLRRAIGVVPQEAVLFNESIAYNIGYGKEGSTQEQIEEAAKAARIYDRILTFPEGWETKVGERGVRLSGGEKQRVSIARTILKDPAILLLDEATSALDTSTEREIQNSLRNLAEGRTSISIAHRLSTITHADLILVLQDGRIAEQGDHHELLAQKGLYYGLWNKQIRAEEEVVQHGTARSNGKAGGGGGGGGAAEAAIVSRTGTPDHHR